MRIRTLAAGACVAVLLPATALAQQTCEQRQANRVAGTVVGAGVGALAGSAVAGHGDRNEGAVIGGLAGAVIGNQLSKGGRADCAHAYGYYDNQGAWHASSVARSSAAGYFDRNGNWVVGAPRGQYDSHGYWAPAGVSGYYDAAGRWIGPGGPGGPVERANLERDDRDVLARIDRMDQRIRRGFDDGSLNRREAREVSRDLQSIRDEAASLRTRSGRLRPRDEEALNDRLDRLSDRLRAERRDRDDDRRGRY
jgi:hypothetical protein